MSFNGILFCLSQAQITVNGNSGTAASPVSHFQRPFSPSSAYSPPASLNSNLVIMQHGRMMGKPLYITQHIPIYVAKIANNGKGHHIHNAGIVYSSP